MIEDKKIFNKDNNLAGRRLEERIKKKGYSIAV